jgi:hypothetical protein
VASRWSLATVDLVGGHAAFDKASIGGFSSSLPARASDDEDASRLLAQSALRSKPASLARCHGDPWDVSRQMALPWPTQIGIPMTVTMTSGVHVS